MPPVFFLTIGGENVKMKGKNYGENEGEEEDRRAFQWDDRTVFEC